MKNLIITTFVVLFNIPIYPAPASSSQPIAHSVCKLALRNIDLLRGSEDLHPWFKNSSASLSLNLTRLMVDHARGAPPVLNQRYFRLKNEFLNDLYSHSKAKMKEDPLFYVFAQTPPNFEAGVMDYISDLVGLTIETFHGNNSDSETATLSSMEQLLNAMISMQPSDAMTLLVAELEVNHPLEYVELKNSSEILALFQIKSDIERTNAELERALSGPTSPRIRDLIREKEILVNTFKARRAALFNRLLKEKKKEELYAAQGMFGTGTKF